MALQAKTGVFVHAGRDAAVKIVDWNNESVAFKVGRRSNNARGGNFTAKLMTEVPLLMRYNNTEDAPLIKMRLEPCTVVDDDGATAGIPFYAVEGNIVQWASLSKKQGVFEHMAWCQKVKLALQLDESQEWLEREQLEYQSYNWDDRTGGNPKLQTGISIVDGGTFKMLDAGLVSQSDTEHWNKLRQRMEDRRYSSAAAKRIVDKLKATGWAHGAPRMRRSNAKTLFADLLRVDSNQHHTCRPKNSSFDAQYVGASWTERSLWGRLRGKWRNHNHESSPLWNAMETWIKEQRTLPYDSYQGYSRSLAATLEMAIGTVVEQDECYQTCLAESAATQHKLLQMAYQEDLEKGSSVAPDKDLY